MQALNNFLWTVTKLKDHILLIVIDIQKQRG